MYFRHLVLAACLLLLSGCGIIDYFFLPPPEDTAQELYEGANDAMQEKNYSQARPVLYKSSRITSRSAIIRLKRNCRLVTLSSLTENTLRQPKPIKNLNLFILAMRLSHTSCTRWGCPT